MSSPGPDESDLPLAFIPLEANPELMTSMLHKLGLSPALAIHDIFSLTDSELLSFIPRPALAVLLVFPVSAAYESHRLAEDALLEEYTGKGPDEPVIWFRQTIQNACGLMGLLHAVANGPARDYVQNPSELYTLLEKAQSLDPVARAKLLEKTPAVATAHREAALQGASEVPQTADDVDLHYVCFVRGTDGTLWELDGRRKGPLARGKLEEGEDVLSEKALTWGALKFLEREGADLRFSALALASAMD